MPKTVLRNSALATPRLHSRQLSLVRPMDERLPSMSCAGKQYWSISGPHGAHLASRKCHPWIVFRRNAEEMTLKLSQFPLTARSTNLPNFLLITAFKTSHHGTMDLTVFRGIFVSEVIPQLSYTIPKVSKLLCLRVKRNGTAKNL